MQLSIGINNKTDHVFTEEKLREIFEKTIEEAGAECLERKKVEISVAFVGEEEIQKINEKYRQKNVPTDILSFAEYANLVEICAGISIEGRGHVFLGELIVFPDYIENSAKENGVSFEDEAAYILSHGLLHLLGFSHGKKMFDIQQIVADKTR